MKGMPRLILAAILSTAALFSTQNKQEKIFSSSIDVFEEGHLQMPSALKGWSTSYKEALALSQEKGKPLLIAFVGSSFCPWSKKLLTEILTHPDFTGPLKENFLFVYLEFAEESSLSDEKRGLKEKYAIQEFPTLLLVHPCQEPIARVGFLPMNPKEFASYFLTRVQAYEEITTLLKDNKQIELKEEELRGYYLKAQTLAEEKYKQQILSFGLQKGKTPFFLLENYAALLKTHKIKDLKVQELRKKIAACDPKNSKGAHFQLAMLEFHALAEHPRKKDAIKTALAPLVEYVKTFGSKDKENLWKAEMAMAQFLFSRGHVSSALEHAKASYQAAPEAVKPEVSLTLDFLESYK